jgi:hypothetical protein
MFIKKLIMTNLPVIIKVLLIYCLPVLNGIAALYAQAGDEDSVLMDAVWIPDNGDGTYTNPVIYADYSDPDMVRVGDDFYMVASSFNCVPGIRTTAYTSGRPRTRPVPGNTGWSGQPMAGSIHVPSGTITTVPTWSTPTPRAGRDSTAS